MKERLEYVDALRGIAILGVILVHSAQVSLQAGHTFELAFTGQRGVQLFYMVSAFLTPVSFLGQAPAKNIYRLSNFFYSQVLSDRAAVLPCHPFEHAALFA